MQRIVKMGCFDTTMRSPSRPRPGLFFGTTNESHGLASLWDRARAPDFDYALKADVIDTTWPFILFPLQKMETLFLIWVSAQHPKQVIFPSFSPIVLLLANAQCSENKSYANASP